jgi:D-arabinose 1-dehydrogenase-like Zn-dependent alcohol dehydrogenase
VHGAAGGVGTAAIQLGRELGLRTIAIAGDEAKRSSRCSPVRTTPSSAAAGSVQLATCWGTGQSTSWSTRSAVIG